MKNSFSFNEYVKTFLFCKLLASLEYSYALYYKEVLLTTLHKSYADYQRFLLCKLLPFLGFCSQFQQRIFVRFYDFLFKEKMSQIKEKKFHLYGKILNSIENLQLQSKILNSRGKFLTLWEDPYFLVKYSIFEKIVNLRENSQPKRKFAILEKILNSGENYQLRREKIDERKSEKQQ